RAGVRERPHNGQKPPQKSGREEPRGKAILDAAPLQFSLWCQREPRKVKTVAPAQAETRAMHDAAFAIDQVAPAVEWVTFIEGEEFLFYGRRRVPCAGDRIKQSECAAEFAVKYRTGQVVAALRTAAQKEAATHPLFGLVDRDVFPGYLRVQDEIPSGPQSAKPAPDDVRLHRPAPRIPDSRV